MSSMASMTSIALAANDEYYNLDFNLDDEVNTTIMTITELDETNLRSIQMCLHPDILNHYNDFQDSLYNLLKDSSFYTRSTSSESYHMVIYFNGKYYAFDVDYDADPVLAVIVTKFNNLSDYIVNSLMN